MKVELLDDNLNPVTFDTRRVLVFGDDGVTPIALALEYQPNMYFVTKCEDPNFNKTLEQLGIKCRTHVDFLKPGSLDSLNLPSPR